MLWANFGSYIVLRRATINEITCLGPGFRAEEARCFVAGRPEHSAALCCGCNIRMPLGPHARVLSVAKFCVVRRTKFLAKHFIVSVGEVYMLGRCNIKFGVEQTAMSGHSVHTTLTPSASLSNIQTNKYAMLR